MNPRNSSQPLQFLLDDMKNMVAQALSLSLTDDNEDAPVAQNLCPSLPDPTRLRDTIESCVLEPENWFALSLRFPFVLYRL